MTAYKKGKGREKLTAIFQTIFQFPEWKCLNFDKNFTDVYPFASS